MRCIQRTSVLALCALQLFLTSVPAFGSESSDPPTSGVPDSFWLFEHFSDLAAVRDINPDPMFKCLTGKRVDLDPTLPSVTYRWSLNVDGEQEEKNPLIRYFTGSTPDEVYGVVVNSDTSHPEVSRVLYTDYKTCGIQEAHFFGNQCILWVPVEMKDSVSQQCIEKHTEICGEGVPLYDKDLCE